MRYCTFEANHGLSRGLGTLKRGKEQSQQPNLLARFTFVFALLPSAGSLPMYQPGGAIARAQRQWSRFVRKGEGVKKNFREKASLHRYTEIVDRGGLTR